MKPWTPQEEGTRPQTHRLRESHVIVHYSQLPISESWEQMPFLHEADFDATQEVPSCQFPASPSQRFLVLRRDAKAGVWY